MSSTLFDLAGEYKALYEMAVSDEEQAEQVFIDTLESIKGELEKKSEGYIAVINRLSMEQKKAEEVAERYAAHANACKSAIKRMKDTALMAMEMMGVTELEGGDFMLKVKKNGGVLPLDIPDKDKVPKEFTKTIVEVKPDNDKIRKFLESEEGKDCEWAALKERGKHVEVK